MRYIANILLGNISLSLYDVDVNNTGGLTHLIKVKCRGNLQLGRVS